MTYTWTPPSLMPLLVPWLAILALLLVGANRTAQAWWIWLPLAAVYAITSGLESALVLIPSQPRDFLCQGTYALGFGFAALWLLAASLACHSRFVRFLSVAFTLAIVSAFAYLVVQSFDQSWASNAGPVFLPVFGSAAAALALILSGLVARRSQRPLVISTWVLLWLIVIWTVAGLGFLTFISLTSNGSVPWGALPAFIGMSAGLSFVSLLPFLVLSSANPLFRSRLEAILHPPEPKAELAAPAIGAAH